jgi:lipoprotein-anchoring transpeptidase ErfK/SrfK
MWPKWTPPRNDQAQAGTEQWKDGMPGGPKTPGPARSICSVTTRHRYRIHGTTEPASIGKAASSGCIRMFNEDVIELYRRTPVGSRVLVYSEGL